MKFNLLFYVSSVLVFNHLGFAQNLEWANGFGGIAQDASYSLTADDQGNSYVTGSFVDTVDFDPGSGTTELISNGASDIFIAKFDPAGQLIWARSIGGDASDMGISIDIDASGNVLVGGLFQDTVDFDPGPGVQELTIHAGSNLDIFILKLTAAGHFVWAQVFGDNGVEGGGYVTTDDADNVYLSGEYGGTIDFDFGPATHNLTSNGQSDIFVLALNGSGDFQYVKSFGSTLDERLAGIELDASNNALITGYYQGTVDFDPGTGTYELTSNGMYDMYVLKLDTAGAFIWAASVGGVENDVTTGICSDQTNNVYVVGYYKSTVDFDPGAGVYNMSSNGATDACLFKLDPDGNFSWARSMGGTDFDFAKGVSFDAPSTIYLTGYFKGTADFDPGTGVSNLISNGSTDIFIQAFDSSGNDLWVKQMGGTSDDAGISIATDNSGNLYCTGLYKDTVDFDPSAEVNEWISEGDYDVFLIKMSSDLGFPENNKLHVVSYPNPTTGKLTVNLQRQVGKVDVSIYNMIGELQSTQQLLDVSSINLNVEGEPGIYIITLRMEGGSFETIRVIKR